MEVGETIEETNSFTCDSLLKMVGTVFLWQ